MSAPIMIIHWRASSRHDIRHLECWRYVDLVRRTRTEHQAKQNPIPRRTPMLRISPKVIFHGRSGIAHNPAHRAQSEAAISVFCFAASRALNPRPTDCRRLWRAGRTTAACAWPFLRPVGVRRASPSATVTSCARVSQAGLPVRRHTDLLPKKIESPGIVSLAACPRRACRSLGRQSGAQYRTA
jgi:hypothetical protein